MSGLEQLTYDSATLCGHLLFLVFACALVIVLAHAVGWLFEDFGA